MVNLLNLGLLLIIAAGPLLLMASRSLMSSVLLEDMCSLVLAVGCLRCLGDVFRDEKKTLSE